MWGNPWASWFVYEITDDKNMIRLSCIFKAKIVGRGARINVRHNHLVGKEIFFRFKIEWIMTGQSKNINFTIIIYKILLLKLGHYAKNTGSSSRENTSNINVNNNVLKFKKYNHKCKSYRHNIWLSFCLNAVSGKNVFSWAHT